MSLANETEYFSEKFDGLTLAGASFSEIVFEGCTFRQCNFSDARFYKCKFVDCEFSASNLSNAKLDYSRWIDVSFKESKLVGVDWTKADWPGFNLAAAIGFSECIISDSSFYGLSLGEMELTHCKAHDVDFRNANLSKSNFSYSDFTNSLFMKTNLQEVDFSEAENYDIDIFNNDIKAARFSRMEAVRLLNCLDIDLVD